MNFKSLKKETKIYLFLSIIFIFPSIIYLITNNTLSFFEGYYSWGLQNYQENKRIIDSTIFLILAISMIIAYFKVVKNEKFTEIKHVYKYILIISMIFFIGLPNMSSDIFYYLGEGWLDAKYNQNPYYVSIKEYRESNAQKDIILRNSGIWSNTTSVYGSIWTIISKITSFLSFGNITFGVYLYKLIELIAHLANCVIIFKITKSKKWVLTYGLNPLILYQGVTNGHNDIILISFILLAMYFLVRKKNIKLSTVAVALSAGIKYFTILLMPFICFYEFRDEKPLEKIKKSIPLAIIFLIVLLVPYIFYAQDLTIFKAMLVQGDRYGGSILRIILTLTKNESLTIMIKYIIYACFILYYLNICIVKNLFNKKVTLNSLLKDYQNTVIFFIFGVLSNFQIWYLIWIFPSLMWQKKTNREFGLDILTAGWIVLYIYFLRQSDASDLCTYQSVFIILLTVIIFSINKIFCRSKKIKE